MLLLMMMYDEDDNNNDYNELKLTIVSILLKPQQLALGMVSKLLKRVKTPTNIESLLIISPTGSFSSSFFENSFNCCIADKARCSRTAW